MSVKAPKRKRHPRLPLGRLRSNLGGNPSLMAVKYGSKRRCRKWTTCDDDNRLIKSNIAVIQGDVFKNIDCGGVFSVDCDGDKSGNHISGDEIAEQFLNLNPWAKWSFRTAGMHGCNVWFKTKGKLPRSSNLYHPDGYKVGEFRSTGNYTMVAGRHPEGMPYRTVVDAPAFTVDPTKIMWLDGRNIVEHIQHQKATQRRERELSSQNCTQDDPVSLFGDIGDESGMHSALQLMPHYLPTSSGQTDILHWDLAGRLLGLGFRFTPHQILTLGRRWYDMADKRHLKSNETRDQYAAQMLHKFKSRRFPAGKGDGTFSDAVKAAFEDDAPELVADLFPESRHIQLAATLCRELARRTANGVFFLSARNLQNALELGSPTTANKIIHALIDIDELIIPHRVYGKSKRKATEYRYIYSDLHQELEIVREEEAAA